MTTQALPMDVLLRHLQQLANQSLALWDLPQDASARLINVSENTTYLIQGTNWRSILRIHRENYHSQRAIQCELAWADALNSEACIQTPSVYLGHNGQPIQTAAIAELDAPRMLVMFHFIHGAHPDEDQDLVKPFYELGSIAARTHEHSCNWSRPEPFSRLTWDVESIFGRQAIWGNWRDAPKVNNKIQNILNETEQLIKQRLTAFGKDPSRFGLIHADMRLANLLVDSTGTRLIDFDDCGFGWFLYDFAAGISFMEDHPQVPQIKAAWVAGYRSIRHLSAAEELEIDTFVMLRRMALLAWIGSHIEATEPQALAPTFANTTAKLAQRYLHSYS